RRRAPLYACVAPLARMAVPLPQKVLVDQVSQRPKHASGIAGRLLCNLLEFRCDGWGSHRISRRSVHQNVMPGVAFPPVGPVGHGSPPSSVLCSATTATLPVSARFARRSLPD